MARSRCVAIALLYSCGWLLTRGANVQKYLHKTRGSDPIARQTALGRVLLPMRTACYRGSRLWRAHAQSSEARLVPKAMPLFEAKAYRLIIGTHSPAIHAELSALFHTPDAVR